MTWPVVEPDRAGVLNEYPKLTLRRETPNNPIRARVGDDSFKQLGPLTAGTRFCMTARKDFSWFTGSSWWTGTLRY